MIESSRRRPSARAARRAERSGSVPDHLKAVRPGLEGGAIDRLRKPISARSTKRRCACLPKLVSLMRRLRGSITSYAPGAR
jgi:hypothetical protein